MGDGGWYISLTFKDSSRVIPLHLSSPCASQRWSFLRRILLPRAGNIDTYVTSPARHYRVNWWLVSSLGALPLPDCCSGCHGPTSDETCKLKLKWLLRSWMFKSRLNLKLPGDTGFQDFRNNCVTGYSSSKRFLIVLGPLYL